ncbi:MAG: hypothetical protein Q4Q17_00825 [Tissierellia bacterium]|nr:hypothetical protein [Tissierellia bacterium]
MKQTKSLSKYLVEVSSGDKNCSCGCGKNSGAGGGPKKMRRDEKPMSRRVKRRRPEDSNQTS